MPVTYTDIVRYYMSLTYNRYGIFVACHDRHHQSTEAVTAAVVSAVRRVTPRDRPPPQPPPPFRHDRPLSTAAEAVKRTGQTQWSNAPVKRTGRAHAAARPRFGAGIRVGGAV